MFIRIVGMMSIIFLALGCAKAPSKKHTIAKIPEASGIAYCSTTQTLVVANDEGTFYELTTEGEILTEHRLGKYDLEGVVCHEDRFAFAIEKGAILFYDRKTQETEIYKLKSKKFKPTKKAGIEGITYIDGKYYLSLQTKEKKEAKLFVVKTGSKYLKLVDIIQHNIIDAAGLEYKDKVLYVVSDKKNKLYLYDLKHQKIIKKIKLDKFAQEGITFDEKGNVYFADDKGSVKRYRFDDIM